MKLCEPLTFLYQDVVSGNRQKAYTYKTHNIARLYVSSVKNPSQGQYFIVRSEMLHGFSADS